MVPNTERTYGECISGTSIHKGRAACQGKLENGRYQMALQINKLSIKLPGMLNFVRGPRSNLYEIPHVTLICNCLNGHGVTGPLSLGSCRNSVQTLGVDVQNAWVRHHFLCYWGGGPLALSSGC